MSILVIGSLNMDISITTARIPNMGETVTGTAFSTRPGGKGGNQAIAVSRLGGNVDFLGVVGNDMYGEILRKNLQDNRVSFYGNVSANTATGAAVITVCDGDNCIILNSGANDLVTPELITENAWLFQKADYVVMQLEIPIETVLTAAKLAKENDCKVIVNPAPYKPLPKELLNYIDILIPNEHEASLLTGIPISNRASAESALTAIRNTGIDTVIITLGSQGSIYNIHENIFFCEARKIKCVDTTAAGDTYIGGLTTMLEKGHSFADAVAFATAAAAITVSGHGAADSIPTFDEVERFMTVK